MKQKLIIVSILLMALAFAAVPAAADANSVPLLPMQLYGTASYANGDALPAGTSIIASIGKDTFTYTMTENGKFGSGGIWGEKFLISGDTAGVAITFSLADSADGEKIRAVETVTYTPGEKCEIALTFKNIGTGSPKLTPTDISIYPESIDIQADSTVSFTATFTVNNSGTADAVGVYDITGTLLDIPVDIEVNGYIPRQDSEVYTFAVTVGPNVENSQTKTDEYAYTLNIKAVPAAGQKTTYLSSTAWESSISTVTTVNGYFAADVVYPIYTEVAAHEASSGILTITSIGPAGSSPMPITSFDIPLRYDASVAVFAGYEAQSGITVKEAGVGYLKITGTGLSADTIAITLKFRSTVTNGNTCSIAQGDTTSTSSVIVKSESQQAQINLTRGSFTQLYLVPEITPAVWAPISVMENTDFSASVTLTNPNKIPVDNVTASLLVGGQSKWSESDLSFQPNERKTFTVPLNLAAGDYTIVLTAYPQGGTSTADERNIHVEAYELSITDKNKADWELWNDYNPSVFSENYPYAFGTYYTTNVAGKVNVTIDFNGKEKEIFGSSFDSNRLRFTTYAYVSDTNIVRWTPMETVKPIYGVYPYSITLEANGKTAFVSGVLTVKEPVVDIKVLETVILGGSETTASYDFDVYNRNGAAAQSVEIALSAGSSGRTLQGMEYLVSYIHGCPEQVTSPMLTLLLAKQYNQEKGALSDTLTSSVRDGAEGFINDYFAYPDGTNAQQLGHSPTDSRYGGFAWYTYNIPSLYYTTIPMYGIALLKEDIESDPSFWSGVELNWDGIDLNASAKWIINEQHSDGDWSSNYWNKYDYLSVQALAVGYPYLNHEVQGDILVAFEKTKTHMDTEARTYDYYAPYMVTSYLYINQTGISVEKDRITELMDSILSGYISGSENKGMILYAAALCDEQYGTSYLSNPVVKSCYDSLIQTYGTSGRWDSTYTTGVAIRGLNAASVLESGALTDSTSVHVSLSSGGTEILSQDITFDKSNPSVRLYLTSEQIQQLYGTTEANLKGTLTVTKPTGITLVSAVTIKEKIPKSAAYKNTGSYTAIPNKHIDLISNNFSLEITPVENIVAGGEYYVPFTVVNQPVAGTDGEAADLGVMILEIVSSDEHLVVFNSSKYPDETSVSYYLSDGTETYINHMYDAENGKLYVYIGSDTGSDSVIKAGETETYYVPLEFTAAGTATIEARVYPMYEDEMMALADLNFTVLGYGNLNLKAVNENDEPLSVDFSVEGDAEQVIGETAYSSSKLEGMYNVTVKYGNTIARMTVPVSAGELSEKSVRFIENVPITITGEGEAYLMAPVEDETISLHSLNHWNAENSARYSLNVSVAGDASNASITIDMPVIYCQGMDTVINSSNQGSSVFDTIQCQALSDGTWISCEYILSEDKKTLTIPSINPAEVTEIGVVLIGRTLGDVTGDGKPNTLDAARVLQASVGLHTFSDADTFYGDVSKNEVTDTLDAARILQYSVKLVDENYITVT